MKKLIPVIVAIVLILIIGAATAGTIVFDKYSYSKETADLKEYFEVSGDKLAIILQDEKMDEKAVLKDGVCYFDLNTVHKYFNDTFYVDKAEGLLLYALPEEVVRIRLGETGIERGGSVEQTAYVPAYVDGEKVYLAADLVKQYSNFSYEVFDMRMQVYTQWGEKRVATVKKDTEVRVKGGIKSPILREIAENEQVEILEKMETWSKVKTSDAFIGYVENKCLTEESKETETPVTDYAEPEYATQQLEEKVCLGWHSIGGVGGNDTLESMVANTKDMNVIAPTWFSLNDNQGGFESFGTADYVERAHNMGLQVWGVLDDFNYSNVNSVNIDVYTVLSSTTNRTRLIDGIIAEALNLGMDGINLDFERVNSDCGEHYAQFIRELSIQCRLNELTFSIDNYVPFNFNEYLRRDVQGKVADYVIIMGYDEHWHGSGDPGSVASIGYVSNGIDKTLEQVPKEKVVNALPFYSILWKVEGATVTDEYLTLVNTQDFLNRIGQQGEWDEETQQLYVEYTSGPATYKLWVENEQSIQAKLNVMKAKEIAGVAVWRLGYGNEAVWQMISAYVNS
ncbi:MAG: SH3 domain-containing protein [Lachnospiraceae bacterium]|nr:SH3 domain-containing protein [Lachnospiraceae bacterium]MBQ7777063.1 SH3 domain-containing protein [Lachnospiraceae bacterium]